MGDISVLSYTLGLVAAVLIGRDAEPHLSNKLPAIVLLPWLPLLLLLFLLFRLYIHKRQPSLGNKQKEESGEEESCSLAPSSIRSHRLCSDRCKQGLPANAFRKDLGLRGWWGLGVPG